MEDKNYEIILRCVNGTDNLRKGDYFSFINYDQSSNPFASGIQLFCKDTTKGDDISWEAINEIIKVKDGILVEAYTYEDDLDSVKYDTRIGNLDEGLSILGSFPDYNEIKKELFSKDEEDYPRFLNIEVLPADFRYRFFKYYSSVLNPDKEIIKIFDWSFLKDEDLDIYSIRENSSYEISNTVGYFNEDATYYAITFGPNSKVTSTLLRGSLVINDAPSVYIGRIKFLNDIIIRQDTRFAPQANQTTKHDALRLTGASLSKPIKLFMDSHNIGDISVVEAESDTVIDIDFIDKTVPNDRIDIYLEDNNFEKYKIKFNFPDHTNYKTEFIIKTNGKLSSNKKTGNFNLRSFFDSNKELTSLYNCWISLQPKVDNSNIHTVKIDYLSGNEIKIDASKVKNVTDLEIDELHLYGYNTKFGFEDTSGWGPREKFKFNNITINKLFLHNSTVLEGTYGRECNVPIKVKNIIKDDPSFTFAINSNSNLKMWEY